MCEDNDHRLAVAWWVILNSLDLYLLCDCDVCLMVVKRVVCLGWTFINKCEMVPLSNSDELVGWVGSWFGIEGCITCYQEKRNEKVKNILSIMASLNLGQDVVNRRERK